jgi:hypothetical protein
MAAAAGTTSLSLDLLHLQLRCQCLLETDPPSPRNMDGSPRTRMDCVAWSCATCCGGDRGGSSAMVRWGCLGRRGCRSSWHDPRHRNRGGRGCVKYRIACAPIFHALVPPTTQRKSGAETRTLCSVFVILRREGFVHGTNGFVHNSEQRCSISTRIINITSIICAQIVYI